jgi:hypothetical protein
MHSQHRKIIPYQVQGVPSDGLQNLAAQWLHHDLRTTGCGTASSDVSGKRCGGGGAARNPWVAVEMDGAVGKQMEERERMKGKMAELVGVGD